MKLIKRIEVQKLLLIIILVVAGFIRFSGINWALPYNPHPDEWNMAAAVSQLSIKENLDPHFYAYGQFPLYLSYFSASIYNRFAVESYAYNKIPWIAINKINIPEAIFFLRLWSAVFGIGIVFLVYLISRSLGLTSHFSLLTSFLATFTPSLIQISHFGTTESLLSFCFLGIIYFSLKIIEKPEFKSYLYCSIYLGLALGSKITALVFLAPLFLATIIIVYQSKSFSQKRTILKYLFLSLFLALTITMVISPYLLLNFQESKRILFYESQIATGKIQVFYTRQFINTTPILFQLKKIFSYALGIPIFIYGCCGFILALVSLIKIKLLKQKYSLVHYSLFIILNSFLIYFLSQAFLFTKWTRFMAPIFPFFPIFAIYFLSHLRNLRYLSYLFAILAIIPGILFSTIYFRPDIRFTASDWIFSNIPTGSKILSESGNVVDIPVRSPSSHFSPVSFDFYHLDENPKLFSELTTYLEKSEYIFVPSKRVYANVLRLPNTFPITSKYYSLLFSGKLGFEEIKVFHPLPQFKILNFKFQIDDEQSEETWTVFDHPTIRIYKKGVILKKADYEKLFE